MSRGDGEGGVDDTMPASAPPLDEHGRRMRASIPPGSIAVAPKERYKLGAELGRGGMGRVVEAYDTQLGRTVALKEVLPKAEGVSRRFLREIQITARLEHPAIVPLYDAGTTPDGRPFYVMRRVTGRPLDEMLKRAANLGERLALLPALLAAIDAVAHAHRRGVIHRDLKPANILVGDLGETVVIDWGLAKVLGEQDSDAGEVVALPEAAESLRTVAGAVFGTPGFMPPEQARGEELGTHADVYALGATLYQLLAGAPPHSGSSATQMLESTLKNDFVPLSERAPGAPPELVAIVEKALSSEPATRYKDGGALGEDVRRFTTGQLVAAHSYTRRQRIGRFAKRHRGALTIGALAAVVLAVLAWVSVSRVLTERDHANTAQRAAEQDKAAAEAARDRLAERNATLVITQAHAELETNPTLALATLKQLDMTSSRLPDARAVAQAAVMRGAWFAMHASDGMTIVSELSLDGRMLLQVTNEGSSTRMLRIWDLDRRRLLLARQASSMARGLWIAGGKVLVFDEGRSGELLDPATGAVTPASFPTVTSATADAAGRLVLAVDTQKHALLWNAQTREVTPLWAGHEASEDAVIAPDGSWLALADRKEMVVLDAAGAVLGTRAGAVTRIVASDHHQIAVLEGITRVQVAAVEAPLVWKDVELKASRGESVIDLRYRGSELDMFMTSGDIVGYRTYVFTRRAGVERFSYRMMEAGDHVLVVPGVDDKVSLVADGFNMQAPLPTPVPYLRVASRAGVSRFAVVGVGLILTFDLDSVTPQQVPLEVGENALFADDDTVLGWRSNSDEWKWFDLRTRETTSIKYEQKGIPVAIDDDPIGGRVLFRDEFGDSRLTLLRKGVGTPEVIATGHDSMWGRLIGGNAVLFGSGEDGRVLAKIGDEEVREAAKLDGKVLWVASLGPLAFAAISDRGEVVRGNLANGALERTNIAPPDRAGVLPDLLGRVLIIADTKLYAWDKDGVVELHKYDRNIIRVNPTEGGLVVTLADNEMELLDPTGKIPPRRLFTATNEAPRPQRSGRMVVGPTSGQQLEILELPSLARWTVPKLFAPDESSLEVAPNMRRVMQVSGSHAMVWDLPVAGADFGAWLDEQTNATVHDDLLTWPWQTK